MRLHRLRRSELAVPAIVDRFIDKAPSTAADLVFLDLEDSVPEEEKGFARKRAIAAINDLDWGVKTVAVRINGVRTPWAYADIIESVTKCPRLDCIVVPKVEEAKDVHFVDLLLDQLEAELRRSKRIAIELLIETARGLTNVREIARASDRLEAMIFGIGDFSISLRSRLAGRYVGSSYSILVRDGGIAAHHWGDPWNFALGTIATVCRAHGLAAIDGPWVDIDDLEGFRSCAQRAAALGFEGKWAIHPSHVPVANEVFSPTEQEVEWAKLVLVQLEEAKRTKRGAARMRGQLVDQATIKLANWVLERAKSIAAVGNT